MSQGLWCGFWCFKQNGAFSPEMRRKRCERKVATPLLPKNIGSRHSPPSICVCERERERETDSERERVCVCVRGCGFAGACAENVCESGCVKDIMFSNA